MTYPSVLEHVKPKVEILALPKTSVILSLLLRKLNVVLNLANVLCRHKCHLTKVKHLLARLCAIIIKVYHKPTIRLSVACKQNSSYELSRIIISVTRIMRVT